MSFAGKSLLSSQTPIVPGALDAICEQFANMGRLLRVSRICCHRRTIIPAKERPPRVVKGFVCELCNLIQEQIDDFRMRQGNAQHPDKIKKCDVPGVRSMVTPAHVITVR